LLDEAAKEAAGRWRFASGQRGPVDAAVEMPIGPSLAMR
jgi:hypothetical protein